VTSDPTSIHASARDGLIATIRSRPLSFITYLMKAPSKVILSTLPLRELSFWLMSRLIVNISGLIAKIILPFVEESLQKAALWEEVKDNLHRKGTFLSGGQQQRLCIARALAMNPEILLLDEPTSALDPKATTRIEELIAELKKEVTILMVTHNIAQAARISDFTAFIYLGELIEYGTTEKMFTVPKDKRTEEYLTGKFG